MSLLSFAKNYELPMSRDYVRHWGLLEAVREILQNALDSDSPFEYELSDDTLRVHSRNATLAPATLLLGCTTKANAQDKIGSFGEGYKIALLVLARGNYNVRILNGDRVWVPSFRMSRQFGTEVLCIKDSSASRANQGLTFEVAGLSPAEIAEIRESCLQMQSSVGEFLSTRFGRILRERPGRLYVGGLFVCETELQFGYDVLPQHLKLERDRQTVSSFDLQWLTKSMWFDTGLNDEIAQLLEAGTKDLEYAAHGAPELVKEACYQLFQQKHPGAVVAKDQEELEHLVEQGMTRVVVVHGAYGALVSDARSYLSSSPVRVQTPAQILTQWLTDNEKAMQQSAVDNFDALITEANSWRGK